MKVTPVERPSRTFMKIERGGKHTLVDNKGDEKTFDNPDQAWREKEKRELDILV